MVRLSASIIALAAAAAMLAGCGNQEVPQAQGGSADAHTASADPTPSATPTPTPTGPSTDDVRRFFAAIASEDPTQVRRVFKLAAPGSIADAYVREQYGAMLAVEQAGQTGEAATFTPVGSGYKSCQGHGAKKQCVVWDNVQAKGARIANFTISGKKLADRLTVGNGKWVPVGSFGKIKVGVAYQSVQSGWLFVVFQMKAGAHPLSINQTDSAYITKGGTQVTAGDWAGPDKLLPGAVGNYYLAFPHVPVGGKLVVDVLNMQGLSDASATIPTT